jgi:1,2-phenylacetyl-CoA epoxidase catalytic subunit
MMQTKKDLSIEAGKELAILLEYLIEGKNRLVDHFTHWCIKGPSLGASAGITAMLQEEIGHVTILKNLTKSEQLSSGLQSVIIQSMKNIPGSWHELIAEIFVFDSFFTKCLSSAKQSSFAPLKDSILKMIDEERFHRQYSEEWTLLLIKSDNFSNLFHEALQKAINELDTLQLSLSTPVLLHEGILNEDVAVLIQEHKQEIMQVITDNKETKRKGA